MAIIIRTAINIYAPPINGTINSAAEPILFIPPNITTPVKITKNTAVTFTLIPNALFIDTAIEFDCTPGRSIPIAITVTIANKVAYALEKVVLPNPFSM